jgi:hypothetical protein
VDLDAQKVSMTIHGETLEAKLDRRLAAVNFVGYCVNSVIAEFSTIELSGR